MSCRAALANSGSVAIMSIRMPRFRVWLMGSSGTPLHVVELRHRLYDTAQASRAGAPARYRSRR
jgi:hypothetical protein